VEALSFLLLVSLEAELPQAEAAYV